MKRFVADQDVKVFIESAYSGKHPQEATSIERLASIRETSTEGKSTNRHRHWGTCHVHISVVVFIVIFVRWVWIRFCTWETYGLTAFLLLLGGPSEKGEATVPHSSRRFIIHGWNWMFNVPDERWLKEVGVDGFRQVCVFCAALQAPTEVFDLSLNLQTAALFVNA